MNNWQNQTSGIFNQWKPRPDAEQKPKPQRQTVVRFSANDWQAWYVQGEDKINFEHKEAPDEILHVKPTMQPREIGPWFQNLCKNKAELNRVIWALINKGILFHPYETLN